MKPKDLYQKIHPYELKEQGWTRQGSAVSSLNQGTIDMFCRDIKTNPEEHPMSDWLNYDRENKEITFRWISDRPCIDIAVFETYDNSQRIRNKRGKEASELSEIYEDIEFILGYLTEQSVETGEDQVRLLRKIYQVQVDSMSKKDDYRFLNAEVMLEIYNLIFEAIK